MLTNCTYFFSFLFFFYPQIPSLSVGGIFRCAINEEDRTAYMIACFLDYFNETTPLKHVILNLITYTVYLLQRFSIVACANAVSYCKCVLSCKCMD